MKYKTMLYAALPAVLGLSLLATNNASAMTLGFGGGGHAMAWTQSPDEAATRMQTQFQTTATLLGLSVDEVKAAWADGKSMKDLAKEKGVTEAQIRARMLEQHRTQFKAQLQVMVTKGIITQTQADARLKFMEAQWAKMESNPTKEKEGKGDRKGGARGGMNHFGGLHL